MIRDCAFSCFVLICSSFPHSYAASGGLYCMIVHFLVLTLLFLISPSFAASKGLCFVIMHFLVLSLFVPHFSLWCLGRAVLRDFGISCEYSFIFLQVLNA